MVMFTIIKLLVKENIVMCTVNVLVIRVAKNWDQVLLFLILLKVNIHQIKVLNYWLIS